ncbi:hypothetical protein QPK32_03770 [Massilia sp. YIM B02763]|uniref:hypothetical protein n=1 Tax=Massilia sp. YIM B02763 TaxID=3050130 RepID=UPI0025B6618C|nr:hypothetical protein [Massilia sp. YIM B02763]MDN4052181.1 hypothetical protein [Massilia sp. YIM B02763]
MDRFLIVYRGAADGSKDAPPRAPGGWRDWFARLGDAVVDPGSLAAAAVEIPNRLLGPKESTSSLSGYAVVQAVDFNAAVALAEACPIFDEGGSVEIARLAGSPDASPG